MLLAKTVTTKKIMYSLVLSTVIKMIIYAHIIRRIGIQKGIRIAVSQWQI